MWIMNAWTCIKFTVHIYASKKKNLLILVTTSHTATIRQNLPYITILSSSAMLAIKVTATVPGEIIRPWRRGLHSMEAVLVLSVAAGLSCLAKQIDQGCQKYPLDSGYYARKNIYLCAILNSDLTVYTCNNMK